jgi:probable DNA metabolism protein
MFNWTNLNKTFIYDGTFEGLLTIVFDCFKEKAIPFNIVNKKDNINSFLENYEYINTDLDKSFRVFTGITKQISESVLYNSYSAFLSGEINKEIHIFKYLIYGFLNGSKVEYIRNLDFVFEVQRLSKKVMLEAHRFKGILRFKLINDNILYAEFEPDNNIIEALSKHFKQRLKNEKWIIHDKKRKVISMYDMKEYRILNLGEYTQENFNIIDNLDKDMYEDLWKVFYNTISIKERKNSKLQMQYMPKRYWKYIIEC